MNSIKNIAACMVLVVAVFTGWFIWQYFQLDHETALEQQQQASVYSACMQARGMIDGDNLWDKCYSLQQSYNVSFYCTGGSGNAYCWTEKEVL